MKLPADLHVSVADPDPALYQRMLPSFTAAGARLRHFGTGAGCLDAALLEGPPCIFVVANELGDMSGLELLRELRRGRVSAPTVLIVVHGDVLSAVHAMREGAMDVIERPVVMSRLLHALVLHSQPREPTGIIGCGA